MTKHYVLAIAISCVMANASAAMADDLRLSPEEVAYIEHIFKERAGRQSTVATPPTQTQATEVQKAVEPVGVAQVTTPISTVPITGERVPVQQTVAKRAMEAPPSGNEKNFHEASAVAGYNRGLSSGVDGAWAMAEYIFWRELEFANLGLGVTGKTWYGSGDNWHNGRVEIGPNVDWYQEVGMGNAVLLKLRPLYRFGQTESGFAPGAYLEFDHIVGRNDTLFAALDVSYFPGDTYLGLSLMDEHRFNRDWKLQYGINLMEQIGDGESVFGIGPGLTLKYHDWKLGMSYTFLPGSPVFGVSLGWEYNSYLREWDADERGKSMKQEVSGQTVPMPTGGTQDEVILTKTESGDAYTTLPAIQNNVGDSITVADKTFDEKEGKK